MLALTSLIGSTMTTVVVVVGEVMGNTPGVLVSVAVAVDVVL